MKRLLIITLCTAALLCGCAGSSHAGPALLTVERTIPLANVKGRIDHLAIDLAHKRLFVAEIANGSVDVIDFAAGSVIKHIGGLDEPQGLAYLPEQNVFVVSCGGDGTVRFFDASTFALLKVIDGLVDADNIRIDRKTGNLVVGYGSGALALIDVVTRTITTRIALPSHPEGFQVSADGDTAYVNLPRSLRVGIVDISHRSVAAAWSTGTTLENFPMAVNEPDHTIAVGFRFPGRFITFDTRKGTPQANLQGCGETDDLFYDAKRQRYYMLCGSGDIDVFGQQNGQFTKLADVPTDLGGRTGLFSPDTDRLYVAVSATSEKPAHVLVMAPN